MTNTHTHQIEFGSTALAGVETRFHGPTDFRGARVSARRSDHRAGDPIVWTSWNYGEDVLGNHVIAARRFLERMEWGGQYVAASTERGYVFAEVPR